VDDRRARDDLADLLGKSRAIEDVRAQIRKLIARQPTGQRLPSVLINGETGTGKGLIARILHRASARANGPFVDVNCAAIPDTLLEAELFGYERGAFTDARQAKAGLFQTAHRGTLFLDEIGLLAEALQAKLLKVIEERSVRRLGATRSEPFDVWLLCATNEDLAVAIRQRRFREDLYHRLAVFTLRLPPLRERGEDVGLLAEEFLARACTDYGLPVKTLAPEARARLMAYPWPGNIRELSNLMERVALLSDQPLVTPEMLALPDRHRQEPEPASMDEPTRDHLLAALEHHQWNISRTAAALGITRNTVRARIARFGLRRGEPPPTLSPAAPDTPAAPAAPAGPATPAVPAIGAPAAPLVGAPIRWERRQIAFLRAALITPPGADTLLDTHRVLETLLEKVRIFAGRVEELSPTSVGGSFGLEDLEEAPRRAAHAAMAVRRALERRPVHDAPAFTARIGLHVAQLLVSRTNGPPEIDGDGKRAAWAALDALLETADPGTVTVSAAAGTFLERRFSLAPLLSGDPTAYRLLGHERTGLRAGRRMASFVGRRQELDLLQSRLATATTSSGQVIGIAGEAGIGKSRLLYEFRQRLRGRRVTWLEAHCVSYGGNIPHLPLLELLRHGCRIDEYDLPEAVAVKVRRALERIEIDPAEAAPYLLQFLGVKPASDQLDKLNPEATQARTVDVLRRMIVQASRRRPLILVVEDLHWVDAASTALASLIEGLDRISVLVLFTYRPGYKLPWMDRSFTTQIALQPLTPEESAVVVSSMLESASVPGGDAGPIIRQADGNPFFLEELARASVEQRSASPPATIQQVLLARINRLSDEARRLLETTAVLGREASVRLLNEMWPEPGALQPLLRDLVHHEFLYPGTTAGGETIYAFKHVLTQEVAYQNLLGGHRRRLHATVGAALEALFAERVDEVVDLLAHHFGESDVDDKAVDYAIRAGEKAIRRWANAEALAAFDTALARLARMPDTEPNRLRRIDAVLTQSEVRFALGEHAQHLRTLEDIRELIERSADPPRRAVWYYWMGFLHDLTGSNPEKTIMYCQEAAAIADAAGLEDIRALVDSCLAQAYDFRGELRPALAAGERALSFFESRGNLWWGCRTLWHLVVASMAVGEWDRALDYCRRALAYAEAMDDRRLRVRTLSLTGSAHIQRGDPTTGLGWCDRALALSPMPFDASVVKAIRGYGLVKLGNLSAGITALEEAVAWFSRARLRYSTTMTALRLIEAHLLAGDLANARHVLTDVLPDTKAAGYRHAEGIAHRLLGEATIPSNPAQAASYLDAALVLLEETGAQNEQAKTLVAMSQVRRATGDRHGAQELLERALGIFEALRTVDEPERVRALLADNGAQSGG
jgi:transcriptional regulator with AAA-type ATPase domain/tetratricopeptide (TPR) repeat protein